MFYHIYNEIITCKIYSGTPESAAKKIWREHKNLNQIMLTHKDNVIENKIINESEIYIFNSNNWCSKSNSKKFKK